VSVYTTQRIIGREHTISYL